MTTKILIVDDEPPARLRMQQLLAEIAAQFPSQVVGAVDNGPAALETVDRDLPDIVLLDISMPGMSGIEVARHLAARERPPAVIFVTAHAGHALKAFELDAVDYLTKPVRRERLLAALQRLAQRRGPAPETAPEGPVLVINDRGRVLRLPHAEVLYLKAEQKYVTLRTADRAYVLDESLTELEQRLGRAFIRVHRNALVARRAIRELQLHDADADGWAVRVAPLDEWLSVSRRQVAQVRAALAGGASAC